MVILYSFLLYARNSTKVVHVEIFSGFLQMYQ